MYSGQVGKDKSARIRLGQLQSTGRRRRAYLIGGILPIIILMLFYNTKTVWTATNPGPVHRGHAAIEADCAACHGDAWPGRPISESNGLASLFRRDSDHFCQKCHAGTIHHTSAREDAIPSCAGCHHDHRGREVSLRAVPDTACTSCHRDLNAHTAGKVTNFATWILGFHSGHPEFKVHDRTNRRVEVGQAIDPGQLKFNHAAHMTQGLKHRTDAQRKWAIKDIPDPVARKWYQLRQPCDRNINKQSPDALVELSCASCHQLDPAEGTAGGRTPAAPTGGSHFQPITYDAHCKGCHPLTVPGVGGPPLTIPHGLEPPAVRGFLLGEFDVRAAPPPPIQPRAVPPLPGRAGEDRLTRLAEEADLFGRWFSPALRTASVERVVFAGRALCGLCHTYSDRDADFRPFQIARPNVTSMWLQHATFSHSPHRALRCQECHPKAGSEPGEPPTTSPVSQISEDVLIPGIDSCRRCHGPEGSHKGPPTGQVRATCITCHQYHNGDHAGTRPAARVLTQRRTVNEWIRGK
jgi:hypothetical protein